MRIANPNRCVVHIRWMIRRDMAEVLDIEHQSETSPWFEEDFIKCLRRRDVIGMVAEHKEDVVGFMVYELYKTRIHVLRLTVLPKCRRRGVGWQMADKLIDKLSAQRRTRITVDVPDDRLPSHQFLRACGFKAVGITDDCYSFLYANEEDCERYTSNRLFQ